MVHSLARGIELVSRFPGRAWALLEATNQRQERRPNKSKHKTSNSRVQLGALCVEGVTPALSAGPGALLCCSLSGWLAWSFFCRITEEALCGLHFLLNG